MMYGCNRWWGCWKTDREGQAAGLVQNVKVNLVEQEQIQEHLSAFRYSSLVAISSEILIVHDQSPKII